MSVEGVLSAMLIMQAPVTGQCPASPSAVQTVAMVGAAADPMAPPSPAFHFRRCKIEPAVADSTNATLLPSCDRTGEVCTAPVEAPPVAVKFVL